MPLTLSRPPLAYDYKHQTDVLSSIASEFLQYARKTSGSWTPAFTASTPPTSVTYTSRSGSWVRNGQHVHAEGIVQLSSKGSGGSGDVRITGLPFLVSSAVLSPGALRTDNITLTAGRTWLVASAVAGQSYIQIDQCGSAVASSQIQWSAAANDSVFWFAIDYITQAP